LRLPQLPVLTREVVEVIRSQPEGGPQRLPIAAYYRGVVVAVRPPRAPVEEERVCVRLVLKGRLERHRHLEVVVPVREDRGGVREGADRALHLRRIAPERRLIDSPD